MANFFVVGTPIGNLEDITFRALSVLKSVDLILCEDTRFTKKLLDHYAITTPTKSYHVHSRLERKEEIVKLLREEKKLALVSDAGTPGISDPGVELVAYIREELMEEISDGKLKIEVIPGPSALTSAISIAGVPCSDFTFLGFLPHKKGRETLFKEIALSERTIIFYESPHRIMKTLESLDLHCKEKEITICRELTKIFEEVISGSAVDIKNIFEKNPEKIRGEFVVLVYEARPRTKK